MRSVVTALALVLLASCGPSWAPLNAPTRPCNTIDQSAYNAAIEAGAAVGRARVEANGTVWLENGPGVVHCATYTSALKPCRRPNDYVVEYTQPDGAVFYVRVPANTEYRFNVRAAPNTCEIVLPPEAP